MATSDQVDTYALRVELKAWEHDFVATNGRKPGSSDIKAKREIAAKYKLYDKLTRGASTKTSTTTSSPSRKRKRDTPRDSGVGFVDPPASATENTFDPPTPHRHALTANGTTHPAEIDPYDPPLNSFFSPSSQRSFVAPTPQKNGRVLGLFDLLSPETARKGTPSANRTRLVGTPSRNAAALQATPSRSRVSQLDLLSATPSRRNAGIGAALTPSRNRVNGAVNTPNLNRTTKLDLEETPECLKRHPWKRAATPPTTDGAYDDADGLMNITLSPIAVRQPRKKFGRSFSELAKDIRSREDKRLDDELDILRDLEQDEEGQSRPQPPMKRARGSTPEDRSSRASMPLGRDISNVASRAFSGEDLPLGPDGEREVDRSDDEGENTKNNRTTARRWKKGPKRQTKKFNIRPTHETKWKPEPKWSAGRDSEEEGNADAVVPETQIVAGPTGAADSADDESDFESADELGSDHEPTKTKASKATKAKKDQGEKKPAAPKKARKVSATAHANFRSLKIKNKNSKAKRGGGRFGRGRR